MTEKRKPEVTATSPLVSRLQQLIAAATRVKDDPSLDRDELRTCLREMIGELDGGTEMTASANLAARRAPTPVGEGRARDVPRDPTAEPSRMWMGLFVVVVMYLVFALTAYLVLPAGNTGMEQAALLFVLALGAVTGTRQLMSAITISDKERHRVALIRHLVHLAPLTHDARSMSRLHPIAARLLDTVLDES